MVKKLSTKYKVVIVNVMVIGLLLCGQYWIDQQNQVDLKSFESMNHQYELEYEVEKKFEKSFGLKDLEKMVQEVKDGKSEQTIFEFEDVDGDNMCFELEPNSGKFDTYTNGNLDQIQSDIKFKPKYYDHHERRYNVKLYGEKPSQEVLYIRPIEGDKAKVDEWLKSIKPVRDVEEKIQKLQFNTFFPGKYRVIINATSTEFMDRTKGPKKVEYKKGDKVEVKKIMLSEKDDRVRVQLTTDDWISAIAFNEHEWLERIEDDQTEKEKMKIRELQHQINELEEEKVKILKSIEEIKFNSIDNVRVEVFYGVGHTNVWTKATKGNHVYIIYNPIYTEGEFLNKKYSLEIKSKAQSHYSTPFYTKPIKKVFNHEYFNAQKKTQQTLQQKIELKEMYRTVMLVSIVTLVFFVIIFVIFYDEEAKAFVFVIVKNENEFEDTKAEQYTPDGANNA